MEAINPKDNERLPLQDKGERERAPIYGIPTAPWPVAEAPMTLIKSRDISESSQVHLYRERLKGVCRSC